MILYSTVGVSDMERAVKFYDAVFGALGVNRAPNWIDGWAGWGGSYDEGYGFCVFNPLDGRAPAAGNGTMIAFRAKRMNSKCRLSTPPHWSAVALMKGLPGRVHIMSRRFMSRMSATLTETNSLSSTTSTSSNVTHSRPFGIYRVLSPPSGALWR